jgi:glutamyl-tRNA synthetase
VRDYRDQGYTAGAILNHLYRLGHSTPQHGFLTIEEMARHFDSRHLGRAPAYFDEQQLTVWQKEAVHRMSNEDLSGWLAPVMRADIDPRATAAFLDAVRPNVVLPRDASVWAELVFGPPPEPESAAAEFIRSAGREFFAAAAGAAATSGNDLKAITAAVRTATARKGAELYMPLRAALTGRAHGPELAPLLKAMPPGQAHARLARFA